MAYPLQKTFLIAMMAFLLVGCQKAPTPEGSPSPSGTPLPSFLSDSPNISPVINEISEDGIVNVVLDGAPEGDSGISMPSPSPDKAAENLLYKNDTASFSANYSSPAGEESLGIVIAIKDDKVSGVKIEPKAENDLSKKFQTSFSEALGGVIVGKKLDEISDLSRVGGASLTTEGFNEELAKIKEHFKK